jgi:hypothetical protein
MSVDLRRGDIFFVRTGGIGRMIRAVTRAWSKDGSARYNHTGSITDILGGTFEARSRIGRYDLSAWYGRDMLVVRPIVPYAVSNTALKQVVAMHDGQRYPWWRLPLHLIPWLARRISYKGRYLVCSELTAKHLYYTGKVDDYVGVNPDDLADHVTKNPGFHIVYEGRIDPGTQH